MTKNIHYIEVEKVPEPPEEAQRIRKLFGLICGKCRIIRLRMLVIVSPVCY